MPALMTPTDAFPAARRSAPDDLRTAAVNGDTVARRTRDTRGDFSRDTVAGRTQQAGEDSRSSSRRWGLLLGGVVVVAATATGVILAGLHHAPTPPVASVPPVPAAPAHCTAASCRGLDPTAQGCQDDARTVAGRVITAVRHGLEVPVGTLEVRASPSCSAAWGRYAIDATAPVDGVTVEGRDGSQESTPIAPVPGHPRLGYGTTPMLAGFSVRALVEPRPGGDLASAATEWTSPS